MVLSDGLQHVETICSDNVDKVIYQKGGKVKRIHKNYLTRKWLT